MSQRLTKILSLFLCFCFILEQSVFAQAIDLSRYFTRNPSQTIVQSDKFRPLHLRYISYDSQNNDFKLLLDKGDQEKGLSPKGTVPDSKLEQETQELMKYFFIGLALPNEKFWVNLRPDSPDNILDPDLEKTDIGRIFLEADLQLKKDTSGMTSPQTKEGREYWDKLYKKTGELFGSQNITIPAITRPWIVPNEIIIRESSEGAYIYKATLKVMLEEDYLNQKTEKPKNQKTEVYNFSDPRLKELNKYSTQLIKETIIPKLTYEVNASKRYAPLRQVYYSLILAQWFKQKYSNFGSVRAPGASASVNSYINLIDSKNLANVTLSQPYDKQSYFQQYQKSFKDGEYNLQEPAYTPLGKSIRRYVSGGTFFGKTMSSPVIVYSKGPLVDEKNYLVSGVSSPMSNTLRLFLKTFQPKDLDPGVKDLLERFGGITSNMIKDVFLTRTDNVEQAISLLVLLKNIKYKFEGNNLSPEQRIDEHLLINVLYNLSQEMDANLFRNGISVDYIKGLRLLEENLRDSTYREAFISLFNQVDIARVSLLSAQSADLPKTGVYPMESHKIIHRDDIARIFNIPTDTVILENAMQDGVKLLKSMLTAAEENGAKAESVRMPKIFEKKFPPNKLSGVITYDSAMERHFELILSHIDGRKKLIKCYFDSGSFTHLSERGVISLGNVGLDIGLLEKFPIGSVVIGPRYNSDRAVLSLCGFIQMRGREGYYIKIVSYSQEEMEFLKSAASLDICFAPVFDPESDLRKIEGRVKELIGRAVEAAGKASSAVLNQPQQAFRQLMDTQPESKVLLVCTGNLNRSPATELLLKNSLKNNGVENIAVESGGTLLWEYITRFLWDIYERGNFRGSREEKLMKAIALDDDNLLNMPKPLSDGDRFNKEDVIRFYFNFNVRYWNDKISGLGRDNSTKEGYRKILNGFFKEVLLPSLDKSIEEYQMSLKNNLLELYIDDKIDGGLPSDFKFGKIVTSEAIRTATVIIAADKYNKKLIEENFPEVKDKIFLFNELAPDAFPGRVNVPDPQAGEIDMLGMIQGIEGGIENNIIPLLKNIKAQRTEVVENENEENGKPIEAKEFLTTNSVAILKVVEKINNDEELSKDDKVLLVNLAVGLWNSGEKLPRHTLYDGDRDFRWIKGDVLVDRFGRNFSLILEDRKDETVKEAKVLHLSLDILGRFSIKEVGIMQIVGLNHKNAILLIEEKFGKLWNEHSFSVTSSPQTQKQKNGKDLGGIALNSLPIQIQAGSGVSSALTSVIKPLSAAEMEAEWAQIQAMVNAAIRPSPERLERYAVSVSSSLDYPQARGRLVGLFADILRNDETSQRQPLLEPVLKNIISRLENNL